MTYDTKNAKQKMVGSIGNSLIICSIGIIANKLHISSGEIFPCTRQFCPTVSYSCMLLLDRMCAQRSRQSEWRLISTMDTWIAYGIFGIFRYRIAFVDRNDGVELISPMQMTLYVLHCLVLDDFLDAAYDLVRCRF